MNWTGKIARHADVPDATFVERTGRSRSSLGILAVILVGVCSPKDKAVAVEKDCREQCRLEELGELPRDRALFVVRSGKILGSVLCCRSNKLLDIRMGGGHAIPSYSSVRTDRSPVFTAPLLVLGLARSKEDRSFIGCLVALSHASAVPQER